MRKIVRGKRARQDLIDIWRYIAEDDPQAADAVLDAIDAKCGLLKKHLRLGPSREDIREGLCYLPVGQYLVLYQIGTRCIRIVRVLHARRDLEGLFSK